jgi:hypothetical protein
MNARFQSCEFLCNSQQRQIDQFNKHITAMTKDFSSYKDSLLHDINTFKIDFTASKHDVFLKKLE